MEKIKEINNTIENKNTELNNKIDIIENNNIKEINNKIDMLENNHITEINNEIEGMKKFYSLILSISLTNIRSFSIL